MCGVSEQHSQGPGRSSWPRAWGALSSATWAPAVGLAVALTLARLVYLAWFCPYELAADEAHYWEWSRRPDLSYYSKGPGIAWAILAGVRLFGDTEFGVRCLAPVAALVAMLALIALVRRTLPGVPRAGVMAVALFNVVPAFQGTSMLMTIDGPYLTCWTLAALAGHAAASEWWNGRFRALLWVWLGIAIGVGFLFKYTILLFAAGFVLFLATLRFERVGSSDGEFAPGAGRPAVRCLPWAGLVLAGLALVLCMSPVLIWNARVGWPTLAHVFGHLNLAGSDVPTGPTGYDPRWTAEYLGAQLGMAGPFVIGLLILAIVNGPSSRAQGARASVESGGSRPGLSRFDFAYLLCLGLPVFAVFLLMSLRTDIEGNWPIAGYLTLIVPAAGLVAGPGAQRFGPVVRRLWRGSVVLGLCAAVVLHAMPAFTGVPLIGRLLPVWRLSGQRQTAAAVDIIIQELRTRTAQPPVVMASHYATASLMAFYLPGRPIVRCAASRVGGRPSQYDYFSDTRLDDPSLRDRPAVLLGYAFRLPPPGGGVPQAEPPEHVWRDLLPARDVVWRGMVGEGRHAIPVFTAILPRTSPEP